MKNAEIKAVIYTGFIDTLIGIESIKYGIDDIVKFRWYHNGWDRLHSAKIRYTTNNRPYFVSYKQRWYLDDAVKTNNPWMG